MKKYYQNDFLPYCTTEYLSLANILQGLCYGFIKQHQLPQEIRDDLNKQLFERNNIEK